MVTAHAVITMHGLGLGVHGFWALHVLLILAHLGVQWVSNPYPNILTSPTRTSGANAI